MKAAFHDIGFCYWSMIFLSITQAVPVSRSSGSAEAGDEQIPKPPINNQVCIYENEIYSPGKTHPTTNPCEICTCQPPAFTCTIRTCEQKPGCKALHIAGQCCPDYVCDCQRNGRTFGNGEKVEEPNPCNVCYCRGGEIQCAGVTCYTRTDCDPHYVPGKCCPKYDHCPVIDTVNRIPLIRVTTGSPQFSTTGLTNTTVGSVQSTATEETKEATSKPQTEVNNEMFNRTQGQKFQLNETSSLRDALKKSAQPTAELPQVGTLEIVEIFPTTNHIEPDLVTRLNSEFIGKDEGSREATSSKILPESSTTEREMLLGAISIPPPLELEGATWRNYESNLPQKNLLAVSTPSNPELEGAIQHTDENQTLSFKSNAVENTEPPEMLLVVDDGTTFQWEEVLGTTEISVEDDFTASYLGSSTVSGFNVDGPVDRIEYATEMGSKRPGTLEYSRTLEKDGANYFDNGETVNVPELSTNAEFTSTTVNNYRIDMTDGSETSTEYLTNGTEESQYSSTQDDYTSGNKYSATDIDNYTNLFQTDSTTDGKTVVNTNETEDTEFIDDHTEQPSSTHLEDIASETERISQTVEVINTEPSDSLLAEGTLELVTLPPPDTSYTYTNTYETMPIKISEVQTDNPRTEVNNLDSESHFLFSTSQVEETTESVVKMENSSPEFHYEFPTTYAPKTRGMEQIDTSLETKKLNQSTEEENSAENATYIEVTDYFRDESTNSTKEYGGKTNGFLGVESMGNQLKWPKEIMVYDNNATGTEVIENIPTILAMNKSEIINQSHNTTIGSFSENVTDNYSSKTDITDIRNSLQTQDIAAVLQTEETIHTPESSERVILTSTTENHVVRIPMKETQRNFSPEPDELNFSSNTSEDDLNSESSNVFILESNRTKDMSSVSTEYFTTPIEFEISISTTEAPLIIHNTTANYDTMDNTSVVSGKDLSGKDNTPLDTYGNYDSVQTPEKLLSDNMETSSAVQLSEISTQAMEATHTTQHAKDTPSKRPDDATLTLAEILLNWLESKRAKAIEQRNSNATNEEAINTAKAPQEIQTDGLLTALTVELVKLVSETTTESTSNVLKSDNTSQIPKQKEPVYFSREGNTRSLEAEPEKTLNIVAAHIENSTFLKDGIDIYTKDIENLAEALGKPADNHSEPTWTEDSDLPIHLKFPFTDESLAPVLSMISDQLAFLKVGEEQPIYIEPPPDEDYDEEKEKHGVIIVPTSSPMTVHMVKVVDGVRQQEEKAPQLTNTTPGIVSKIATDEPPHR